MTDPAPALALAGIWKRFGDTTALADVSLRVRKGTVHALLGENGAGKTTLMHIAYGMVRPDDGSLHVDAHQLRVRTPADAIAAGIGMVHQHFTLVPAMSVAENLALGGHGRLRSDAAAARVREIARDTGFALDPSAPVETLSVGAQQRVEIAKALVHRATILVLDEPTAVLAPAEVEDLLRWIRRFADQGNAVVLITHRLVEALSIADDVTVLRHGRVVHHGPANTSSPDSLTSAMIGQEAARKDGGVPAPNADLGGVAVLRARDVTLRDARGNPQLRAAMLEVNGGEIVGIAGVEGAGHRELLRALAGRRRVASGEITRPARLGFVPEDRHRDAVLLDRSLVDNVALRNAGLRTGRIRWAAVRRHTEALMQAFDVRAPTSAASMRTLSGGNQQKLVLARELDVATDAPVPTPSTSDPSSAIIVENPTRGLDVLATSEVHARLRAARNEGRAVVIYSSDLDEVLALADRMFVAFAGTLREVPVDRDAVGRAMLGLA